jgi:hypothetical protein
MLVKFRLVILRSLCVTAFVAANAQAAVANAQAAVANAQAAAANTQAAAANTQAAAVDLYLVHGHIYTGDPAMPWAPMQRSVRGYTRPRYIQATRGAPAPSTSRAAP